MQSCSALPLNIYDHVAPGYPDNPLFLPSWKCVEHTLELTALPVQRHLDPSCWGSICRCETCTHDIWGSWCTPIAPQGHLTYLLPFLWPLKSYSYIYPQSPTWYCRCQSGRGEMNIPGPYGGMHFLIPRFIRLITWIPLVPVPLDFHKPLMQKLMHTPPLFPLQ